MSTLQDWANYNEPSDKMIWKKSYWDQIIFVRDIIPKIFTSSFKEYMELRNNIQVVSTHTSKSIKLPVYRLSLLNGAIFTIRNNFYDWKISIDSQLDIDCDFTNLFDLNQKISYLYCEGFERSWVFGSYKENKKKFTIEIQDEYYLFTFFWLINNFLTNKGLKNV